MDTIDVLGVRPERRQAFTGELLAVVHDAELQLIVEAAARELEAPIALVTLVLDQIQFFRAQHGLPDDLAAARGTHRDVSFCQLVVRDEETLEVTDAPSDTRIPQHFVKEYGIRSYLGIPIRVQDTVVGSLCVLDTKPRSFTEEEQATLERLSSSVDDRLSVLASKRSSVRAELTATATAPALAELRESLHPVRQGAEAGFPAITAIRSFLQLAEFELAGGSVPAATRKGTLAAAVAAATECDDVFYGIQASVEDCEDCVAAIEHLNTPSADTRLSDVLVSVQDLVRQSTRPAGGMPVPDLTYDPALYTPRPLAVATLAGLINNVAERLASRPASDGLQLEVRDHGSTVEVGISAAALDQDGARKASERVSEQLGEDPSVGIRVVENTIWVGFATRSY